MGWIYIHVYRWLSQYFLSNKTHLWSLYKRTFERCVPQVLTQGFIRIAKRQLAPRSDHTDARPRFHCTECKSCRILLNVSSRQCYDTICWCYWRDFQMSLGFRVRQVGICVIGKQHGRWLHPTLSKRNSLARVQSTERKIRLNWTEKKGWFIHLALQVTARV